MRFQAPRGTEDVLPSEVHKWLRVESIFRELTARYGYQEIRTPTFEDTELFARTSGETSDIVTKQMYSFEDKGGRNITLKPEGTAPVMRAVVEHNLCPPGSVTRLSYVTPFYRYERPQKGRLREAHQVGIELIGSNSPNADVEVIELTYRFFEAIGLTDLRVLVNSIGREECREAYRQAILEHAKEYIEAQAEEGQARIRRNPMRLLDSKDPEAQGVIASIPPITDYLEADSKERLEAVQRLLKLLGVPFVMEPGIVRGLDYYTETVFEVQSTKLGAQSSLCGGGRYDKLVQEIGGSPTPSVGVGMGIERALIVMEASGVQTPEPKPDVFLVQASPEAAEACVLIARDLRSQRIATVMDPDARSMKSQLRQADRSGARVAVILGADELAKGTVVIRDLATSNQREVPREEIIDCLTDPS